MERCRISRWIARILVRPDLARYLAALAVLICLPALWLGWIIDDQVHRAALVGVDEFPQLERSPFDLFNFVDGDLNHNRQLIDQGLWPWWSDRGLRLNFMRPVTGMTHGLDYLLWPRSPPMMHLHSLLWLAVAVVAATRLYRRWLPEPVTAGLAALLFALDDVHGMAATWLANRNAVVAVVFALLALTAHDRWRRDGWLPGAVWTPVLMLLGLLSNEGAVAVGAYLLAYAIFLEDGSWRSRLISLAPSASVGVAWAVAYKLLGHGAAGSGVYLDPGTSPVRFAQAAVDRAPSLLRGLLAWPPAELDLMFTRSARPVALGLSFAILAVLGVLFWTLLRRDPRARFLALGMLLSIVPACSTFPSNRLLLMASLGGLGLVALWLEALWRATRAPGRWRRPAWGGVGFLVAVHVVIPPLSIQGAMQNMKGLGLTIERAAASLPVDDQVREQWVVIVNTPTAFVSGFGPVFQAMNGQPVAARTLILGSSMYPIEVERRDEQTLVLRPEGGFLAPPGTPRPGSKAPSFHPLYILQMFDHLFRDQAADPLELGERIELEGVTIEILGLEEGRPSSVSFRFDRSLEAAKLRWLQWQDGVYLPLKLPEIGQTVTLGLPRFRPAVD